MREALAVFPTTHLTLKGEKTLVTAGIRARAVMKPRGIASDCGLAVAMPADDLARARAALGEGAAVAWYRREGGSWVETLSTGSGPGGA